MYSIYLWISLAAYGSSVQSLTADETCELCQLALRTVYGHFSADVPSKRSLSHQLKRECNRHFNYRRRCTLLMKSNNEMIYRDMKAAQFKPINVCYIIKECKPLQSPITADFKDKTNPLNMDQTYSETVMNPSNNPPITT